MIEAILYTKENDGSVSCRLCAFHCRLAEGRKGHCGVRVNRGGVLYSLNADRIVAAAVDPIEKKPLFHFLPGSMSFSLACAGCNFRCRFCQNSDISQVPPDAPDPDGTPATAAKLVYEAMFRGCRSISYTYSEPTVFFELVQETGLLARSKGLKNVLVSNGYLSAESAALCREFLDAANIDLKGPSDDFYRKYCQATLDPVLQTIRRFLGMGIHVEATTLLIPGGNDSPEDLTRVARLLADIDPEIPWHISAFHPAYLMTGTPRTPSATLLQAEGIGLAEGLKYIYCGNAPHLGKEDTFCPSCRSRLVERTGFHISVNRLTKPECPDCGAALRFVL